MRFGEVSTNLNGSISSGYTANYGNQTASDHGWTVGGAANLSGSFYSPNFLSFDSSVYVNQSRANSNFQSISDASGISLSSNIFGGSHFPGSLSYSKTYNSEGNYAVPGIANYVTHGNNDTFGINWNENLPDKPSLSAGFQMGRSNYSVYGSKDTGDNAFHSINLHSAYTVADFNLSAFYSNGSGHALIPKVVTGGQDTETRSDNNGFGMTVSRQLPLHGSASVSASRSNWNSNYLGSQSTGTINTVNASATVHPTEKLLLMGNANYSDNLSGQLYQAVVAAGGVIPGVDSNQSSDSVDLMAIASYNVAANMQTSGFVERRTQTFLGSTYEVRSFGSSMTYGRKVAGGLLNASVTISDNQSPQNDENSLGLASTTNYSTEVRNWHLAGSFGYAQNAQTLLITYMNSYYNYSGSVRRRWGRFNLSAGTGGAHTALTQVAGTSNSSISYNGSMSYSPWITASGNYSRSDGQAIATGAGLVASPVPTPVLPSDLVSLFGGNSYSFSLSSSPRKKLVMSGSYSKAVSNTSSAGNASSNQNNQYNALVQYQLRKLSVNSGFARLEQGFSGSGTQPQVISSFYVGVSRWFNFF